MPRSRATEMPQRPSPRLRSSTNLRTSSSNSDPTHIRPARSDKSPKLSRGSQCDPTSQKKLGTRIADLESQLGLAQDELQSLKNQLSSAEAAKKAAQEQLQIKKSSNKKQQKVDRNYKTISDGDGQDETDVFEVPVENVAHFEQVMKPIPLDEWASKKDEISCLKAKLDDKVKEVEDLRNENQKLKCQLNEKLQKLVTAESEVVGLTLKLNNVNQELEKSKMSDAQIGQRIEAAEKAKAELENEMKSLCVQTEQWRKAADAAAAILAGEGVGMNGRGLSNRFGSMDKYSGTAFDSVSGYSVGSPRLMGDPDYVFGGGKKKGSGIRILGDLWKKKGHK